MRNLSELRARIYRGEIISSAEMAQKYYPTQESLERVSTWLRGEGIETTLKDSTRLSLSAAGSIRTVSGALNVSFGKVQKVNDEADVKLMAIPSAPSGLERDIVGFHGLQSGRKRSVLHRSLPTSLGNLPVIGPTEISTYYGASHLGLDGSGQTIAVIADSEPDPADLQSFWTNTGGNQTGSRVVIINPSGLATSDTLAETTTDIEWAGGIAPGAKLRVYVALEPWEFVPLILEDAKLDPGLLQVSDSFGGFEAASSVADFESDSQYFAALAAAGISFFNASGDWGQYSSYSSPSEISSGKARIAVASPASDPCVTAVGGTTLIFPNSASIPDLPSQETGWNVSGGGQSVVFGRPTWQTGPGITPGGFRLVPDVAAVAFSRDRALYVVTNHGYQGSAAGTSLSTPIWAGLCAIINQSRANAAIGPLGLLGPKIYPLIGSSSFRDITATDDYFLNQYHLSDIGTTSATPGWDSCTGVGTPVLSNLIQALGGVLNPVVSAPVIIAQPQDAQFVQGTLTFSLVASTPPSAPILGYQWRMNNSWFDGIDDSNPMWIPLVDSATIIGSTTPTLEVQSASNISVSTKFSCAIYNQYGYTYTTAVSLVTGTAPTITTQPLSQSVSLGSSAVLSVASPNGSTYQWYKDNTPLTGQTANAYTITNASPADEGSYTATVTNAFGSITSSPALISVASAHLTNISTRSPVGTGAAVEIGGFIISGSLPKKVLIRASGPALAKYNISGNLTDPVLELHQNGSTSVLAKNDDWDPSLRSTFQQLGVDNWDIGSKDSAILTSLAPGGYTAIVSGKAGTTGIALIEVFDADQSSPSKLSNISTRSSVATGSGVQIAGFILSGSGTRQVLIRGAGPFLTQFGVAGVLSDPVLTVFDGPAQIAQNDDWSSNAVQIQSATQQIGVVAFSAGSPDSALVLTVQAGKAYTVQISGKNGATGVALVEVYELP